jgi:hypothetical protein
VRDHRKSPRRRAREIPDGVFCEGTHEPRQLARREPSLLDQEHLERVAVRAVYKSHAMYRFAMVSMFRRSSRGTTFTTAGTLTIRHAPAVITQFPFGILPQNGRPD